MRSSTPSVSCVFGRFIGQLRRRLDKKLYRLTGRPLANVASGSKVVRWAMPIEPMVSCAGTTAAALNDVNLLMPDLI